MGKEDLQEQDCIWQSDLRDAGLAEKPVRLGIILTIYEVSVKESQDMQMCYNFQMGNL